MPALSAMGGAGRTEGEGAVERGADGAFADPHATASVASTHSTASAGLRNQFRMATPGADV